MSMTESIKVKVPVSKADFKKYFTKISNRSNLYLPTKEYLDAFIPELKKFLISERRGVDQNKSDEELAKEIGLLIDEDGFTLADDVKVFDWLSKFTIEVGHRQDVDGAEFYVLEDSYSFNGGITLLDAELLSKLFPAVKIEVIRSFMDENVKLMYSNGEIIERENKDYIDEYEADFRVKPKEPLGKEFFSF